MAMNLRNYQPVGRPFHLPGERIGAGPLAGRPSQGTAGRAGTADQAFPELQNLGAFDESLNPELAINRRREEVGIQRNARGITQNDLGGGGLNLPGATSDFSIPQRVDTSALQSFVDRAPPPLPGKPARPELAAAPDRIDPLSMVGLDGPGPMPNLQRRSQAIRPPPRRV